MAQYRKFKNEPFVYNGEKFDSAKEFRRWGVLRLLQRAGKITNLRRQVKFSLIPKKKGEYRTEQECSYIADFTYEKDGKLVVEDVKSPITRKNPEYIIKRKLMLYKYDISIKEVLDENAGV